MTENRILKIICGILAGLSFLMLIGTAGALECDTISFKQSIVRAIISIICLFVFAKLAGAFDDTEDSEQSEDIEIDRQELFRQINHHISIDGYRVFAEKQSGKCYTVTLLSQSDDKCVLAEVEDFTDEHGAIKIITF